MTRGPSDILDELHRRHASSSATSQDDPTIPWTFNQILLPIILVLTFIILTEIYRYREAHAKVLGTIRTLQNEPTQRITGQITAINLQLQILLRKLEFEKSKERISSKLALFPDSKLIRRAGTTLQDDNFKFLCVSSVPLLDENGYQEKAATIYSRILAEAGVSDPASSSRLEHSQVFSEGELTAEKVREFDDDQWLGVLNFDPSVIAGRNRQILQNAILEFVDNMRTEIKTVQLSLLRTMFAELLEHPESEPLTSRSRGLIEQMVKPDVTEQQRELLTKELYRNMLNEWKVRYEKDGYPMPVWRSLTL